MNLSKVLGEKEKTYKKSCLPFLNIFTLNSFSITFYLELTTWKNAPHGKIVKSYVSVANNYLTEKEIKSLDRFVTMYLLLMLPALMVSLVWIWLLAAGLEGSFIDEKGDRRSSSKTF